MPVSIVVGIRFGSERKRKVALEAARCNPTLAGTIRVGGTNSGQAAVAANGKTRALWHLRPPVPASDVRLVIGVSGPIAAGKTTVCRYLEGKGFSYARFSAVIDDMLRQAGLPIDRSHQQAMGEQVNRSPGQRWLCRELMHRVPDDARQVVIDGLRFPEDHAFFAERLGPRFLHLHITATRGTREARYIHTSGTTEDFQTAESAPTESQHDRMASLAHVIVENQVDLSHLWKQIDRTIGAARPDMGGLLCQ